MSYDLLMRILLVEDEPLVRGYLVRALAQAAPGATIVVADDGRQALGVFAESPPDLVISDNHMPRMSGLELLCALRAHSAVPFVLISADVEALRAGLRAGASRVLTKPFTLAELSAVVEELV